METSVDYESLVSIRSTVVDFLEEAFQQMEFSGQVYQNTVGMLATDNIPTGNKKDIL